MTDKRRTLLKEAARAELARRRGTEDKLAVLLRLLSPLQRKFLEDPSRFKLIRGGRRAGKSFVDAVYMIYVALSNPQSPVLYLGLTRESAKEAVWPILLTILHELNIAHEPLESGPVIKFSNGSQIRILGADAVNVQNRLRGRKFRLVIVDEMGFFQEADGLIKKILVPTLGDYQGTLVMTSSPGEQLLGMFYDADQGVNKEQWSRYTWTLKENPHYMKAATDPRYATLAEQELATVVEKIYGGNWQHPAFRREYLAEWVRDATSLMYPYSDHNLIDAPYAMDEQEHGLGIDLGSASANAIVCVRYSPYSRKVQVIDEWIQPNVRVDELAAVIKRFVDKYNPIFMVADTGGYGRGIVDEIIHRYHMPITPADKKDKSFHQRIMRNDLISGYIQVVRSLPLLEEWSTITRDENDDEIRGVANHGSDATLYIYRKIYNTILKSAIPRETEEERMISQIVQSMQQEDEEKSFIY